MCLSKDIMVYYVLYKVLCFIIMMGAEAIMEKRRKTLSAPMMWMH